MFTRFLETIAVRILLKSRNISLLVFKDRDVEKIFMAASPADKLAMQFYERNVHFVAGEPEPASLMLERLFHSPDAEHGDSPK